MRKTEDFRDPLYEKPVDLHCHSTRSDGTLTPAELVALAGRKGLAAFALTDHDSVAGVEEAMQAARGTGIEVVPGIEISTEYEGRDVHVVGLYYDYQDPAFLEEVKEFTDERSRRNRKMAAKLTEAGYPLRYEALEAAFPGSAITRANFARYMADTGMIPSYQYAFDHLIGDDCPCFVPREHVSPERAVSFIRKYHGVPILAHPFQYQLGDEGLEKLIVLLKAAGLAGIEAYYAKHTPEMTAKVKELAAKYGLLVSGGSDFHGDNKPGLEMGTGYGHLFVPYEVLAGIKQFRHGITDRTKIFFSDFDGTLGTSTKDISPLTRQALDDFTDRGNLFCLSSGRAMSDVKGLRNRLGLFYPHMFLSAYNGAEICDCDRDVTFFRESLPFEIVRTAFRLAAKHGLYCQTYDREYIVVEQTTKETAFYTRNVKMPVRENPLVGEKPEIVLSEQPSKCLVIELEDPRGKIPAFRKELDAAFPGQLNLLMSNANYLEIDPKAATKGNALIYLCRYLGINRKNAVSAGDAPNDIPMIEAAGCGIAMINGVERTPALEDAASVVTGTDNDHDGLAPILDRL